MDKILSYYVLYVWETRKLIGTEISENTHKTYRSRAKMFREYLRKRKMVNAPPSAINKTFVQSFHFFLIGSKKMGGMGMKNTSSVKHIQMLRTMLESAMDDNVLVINAAKRYKIKYNRDRIKVFLDLNQLTRIKNYPMPNEDLTRARDMFLFMCYTSLTYSEIKSFNKKNVVRKAGESWLKKVRQKTTVGSTIVMPLLSGAEEILKRYGYNLPVSANNNLNDCIKRVLKIAKIEGAQNYSSKAGRKTFGNILVNDFGVDIKTVSVMMGHESVETTERWYVDVNEKKIKRDMKEVLKVKW